MAYKINKGYYGDTDLAGVKFWVAGDLGHSWQKGNTEWAVVTFQPGTTDAQKAGVSNTLGHIFPVKWKAFEVAEDAEIEWTATEDRAEAKLAKGVKAHIILNKWQGTFEYVNRVLTNFKGNEKPKPFRLPMGSTLSF